MIAIIVLALLLLAIWDAKQKATEMPDTYEETRTWVKMKRGNKEYWVVKKSDGVITHNSSK